MHHDSSFTRPFFLWIWRVELHLCCLRTLLFLYLLLHLVDWNIYRTTWKFEWDETISLNRIEQFFRKISNGFRLLLYFVVTLYIWLVQLCFYRAPLQFVRQDFVPCLLPNLQIVRTNQDDRPSPEIVLVQFLEISLRIEDYLNNVIIQIL